MPGHQVFCGDWRGIVIGSLAMKQFLFVVFVITGIALSLGEALLFLTFEPDEASHLPSWLPLVAAFLLFAVAFTCVGVLQLPAHVKEAAGWIVLLLLSGVAAYVGFVRLSMYGFAVVEIIVFACYAITGLAGATLALRRGSA